MHLTPIIAPRSGYSLAEFSKLPFGVGTLSIVLRRIPRIYLETVERRVKGIEEQIDRKDEKILN